MAQALCVDQWTGHQNCTMATAKRTTLVSWDLSGMSFGTGDCAGEGWGNLAMMSN